MTFTHLTLGERLFLILKYGTFIGIDPVGRYTYHKLDGFYVVVVPDHKARRILAIEPFTNGMYFERMLWCATRAGSN